MSNEEDRRKIDALVEELREYARTKDIDFSVSEEAREQLLDAGRASGSIDAVLKEYRTHIREMIDSDLREAEFYPWINPGKPTLH